MKKLSVVIPTWNEEGNIQKLVERIHSALYKAKITYEIIFVDDYSEDKTRSIVTELKRTYPISLYLKKKKRGKAQSIIEGSSYAKYKLICMIDADLQYPPEAIPQMVKKIENGADFVVTNRKIKQVSFVRTFISTGYNLVFNKLLHGFDFDVQSGLKVFKREIINNVSILASNWALDLELVLQAKQAGYTIVSHDIIFAKRDSGGTKINLIKASFEIGCNAIRLKLMTIKNVPYINRISYVIMLQK